MIMHTPIIIVTAGVERDFSILIKFSLENFYTKIIKWFQIILQMKNSYRVFTFNFYKTILITDSVKSL